MLLFLYGDVSCHLLLPEAGVSHVDRLVGVTAELLRSGQALYFSHLQSLDIAAMICLPESNFSFTVILERDFANMVIFYINWGEKQKNQQLVQYIAEALYNPFIVG